VATYVASQRPIAGAVLISPYDSMVAVAHSVYPFLPVSLLLRHRFESDRRAPSIHVDNVERLLTNGCEYSRLGSGALGMAYVADGRFEGYFEPHINAWDVTAGIVIVREAGGFTNDFFAGERRLERGNAILAGAPGMRAFLEDTLGDLMDG